MIRETCACGATVDVQAPMTMTEARYVAEFREAHAVCRTAGMVKGPLDGRWVIEYPAANMDTIETITKQVQQHFIAAAERFGCEGPAAAVVPLILFDGTAHEKEMTDDDE